MSVYLDPETGLTESQLRAIRTLDRPLVTTAGPGAGKTRVLTERYLHLLAQPNVEIENIVAITFTNKAANEMRERIRKGLAVKIAASRKTSEEPLWRERKRRLDAAVITTIHGFCSRLLREFPIEAEVDPRFSTLDDYTSSIMLNAAAEAAVTAIIDSSDESGAQLVAAYGRGQLVDLLETLYNQLRGLGVSMADACELTRRQTLTVDDYTERFQEARQRIVEILTAQKLTAAAQEKVNRLAEVWERFRPIIEQTPEPERSVEVVDAIEEIRKALPDARTAALKEIVPATRKYFGDKKATEGALAKGFFDVCSVKYQEIVFKTLNSIDFLYKQTKHSAQALDYEDLQLFTRAVLKREDVRRRIGSRYRHYLIDEFQDTNRLQREIIDLLTLENSSRSAETRTLFLVGDRKQSIYNFRGAEVEVFEEAIRDVTRQGGERISLDVNFRSDKRLITFFNHFFERLMKLESGDEPETMFSAGFVEHEPGVANREELDDTAPAVEFLFYERPEEVEDTDDADDSLREIEARRLARRVKQIVTSGEEIVRDTRNPKEQNTPRAAEYRDFALLLSAFTDVKVYEQAFRAANVPYYVVAGYGFYNRPEVADILTLLEFLDNRSDEISLAGVLRSPLFGISDETLLRMRLWNENGDGKGKPAPLFTALVNFKLHKGVDDEQGKLLAAANTILLDLLTVRNRLPLSQLIDRVVRATQFDAVCAAAEDGPQRLSNLDKLIAQARSFERRETRLLRDFVEYIREFRRLETREAEAQLEMGLDAVAILTIHKSKGLEFPIVLLPDLQRERNRRSSEFVYERNIGLGFNIPDWRGEKVSTAIKEDVSKRIGLREVFESIRKLYVGMTRAEDRLILSAATKPLKANDKPLRDSTTILGWLLKVLPTPENATGEEILNFGESTILYRGREVEFPLPPEPTRPNPAEERLSQRDFVRNVQKEAREREKEIRSLIGSIEDQLQPVEPVAEGAGVHYRYSVTQLVNFMNCPRQYYFARFLQASDSELRAGDDAEAREGRTRLPASVRGLVMHRFCDTFQDGDDADRCLRNAVQHVRRVGTSDGFNEYSAIDDRDVVFDLKPLVRNFLDSRIRTEIDERRKAGTPDEVSGRHPFVLSEIGFTLRTEAATILGAMDKILLTETPRGIEAHVIDFKTNSLWLKNSANPEAELTEKAAMYRVQMQAYALAAWWLIPNIRRVSATLHFLHPNREFRFPDEQMTESAALRAVTTAAGKIRAVRTYEESSFETNPGARCINCRFNDICPDAVIQSGV